MPASSEMRSPCRGGTMSASRSSSSSSTAAKANKPWGGWAKAGASAPVKSDAPGTARSGTVTADANLETCESPDAGGGDRSDSEPAMGARSE